MMRPREVRFVFRCCCFFGLILGQFGEVTTSLIQEYTVVKNCCTVEGSVGVAFAQFLEPVEPCVPEKVAFAVCSGTFDLWIVCILSWRGSKASQTESATGEEGGEKSNSCGRPNSYLTCIFPTYSWILKGTIDNLLLNLRARVRNLLSLWASGGIRRTSNT